MSNAATLIPVGESETVEFKEQWVDRSALRELAAFANTSGGTLLIGVADDGSVVGWKGNDLDALANKITDSLRLHPSKLHFDTVDREPVLVVSVPEAQQPVAYRGRYYHRVGATTREIPPAELARFLTKRSGQTWDALPSGQSLEAVSREDLQHFVRRSADRLPVADPDEPIEDLLAKLDLLAQDGSPSRAALLLFGENAQALAFSAHVRMGRFKDDITIVDEKPIKGTLFDQLDGAMRQFRQYLEVRYQIPEETEGQEGIEMAERREVWTYPLAAMREAVVNALIHRDYAVLGNIEIRVFDGQLTVSSPGGLPEGITLEELKQPRHASIQRNPRLAQTFYYAGFVERWGTGTTRIAEACQKQGLPVPEFESSAERFTVTFRKDPYTEARLQEMGFNERQILAVRYAQEHGHIDNATLQELANVTKRTASRDLSDLTDRDILRKVGQTGKGTYYEPTSAGRNET
ncbi:MAG: transcriptional regulator [Bacteroidetes bacterium]|jgi:ATP-dependent DNA helicase RecG|nr:transcriptional regulator [Bacteroidota bacterium]